MAVIDKDSYLASPMFKQAQQDFQAGKWEEGLAGLAQVEKDFPLATELRGMRLEMQIRSRIDSYEIEENKRRQLIRLRNIGLRLLLVLLVGVGLVWTINTYSGVLTQQWSLAQQTINNQVRQTEITIQFMNAQQLLQAGQSNRALEILTQIAASDPEYPGLANAIAQAQAQQDLENQYNQAMEMLAAGNTQDALAILELIDRESPQYRDVALQIQSLQTRTQLENVISQADQAFDEERWDDAIAGYESVRILDPTFQANYVESQLFQAYIQAAESVLDEPIPSLEALQTADGYFSQALALRPQDRQAISARTAVRTIIEDRVVADYIQAAQQALVDNADSLEALAIAENYFSLAMEIRPNDPNILNQFQLAQLYLQAIASYNARDYADVIDTLEFVVGQDPNYAAGTARQTLYEAYIAQGRAQLSTGEYELAIADFQSAAGLAQSQNEEQIAPAYFEALILIAEAQGLAGNFEDAVLLYQTALADSGMREVIASNGGRLYNDLINADASFLAGNYQRAFQRYRTILASRIEAYDTSTVVRIKTGDYITSLARMYGTTVSAILAANNLTNPDRLNPDSELIIPLLP
jgi:tetratricopeptide (TPR) repeat protein